MSVDRRVASRHTFAMLLTRFAPQASVLGIAGARPRPMEAINSHKQGPRAPQTVPRTCCACRCLDAGRSRRADLTRGRAGRHGAEFPPGRGGCAMTDPVMRALAYLSRVVEPPCPLLAALMARVGPVEAADRVKRRASDEQLLRATEARHEINCATRDLGIPARLGGRLV